MRFLVDNAISPVVADGLRSFGHDAIHVRDCGLATAADQVIFDFAVKEDRIIVSADTDFGLILVQRQSAKPSFLLFRGQSTRDPSRQAELIQGNLPVCATELASGAVVVIDGKRLRIRKLPMLP